MQNHSIRTSLFTWFLNNWHKCLLVLIAYVLIIRPNMDVRINLSALWEQLQKTEEGTLVERHASAETHKMDMGTLPLFSQEKQPAIRLYADFQQVSDASVMGFVNRFGHVARNEQQKFGVPASIILAAGLLCSQAGQHHLAQADNNYFMVPCTPSWGGARTMFHGQCVRKYETAWLGFRNHSQYLSSNTSLNTLHSANYQTWAKALEQHRIYPVPQLSKVLVEIIDRYQLADYDA